MREQKKARESRLALYPVAAPSVTHVLTKLRGLEGKRSEKQRSPNDRFAPTAVVPYRPFCEAQSGRGHEFTPERYHEAQNLPDRILSSTLAAASLWGFLQLVAAAQAANAQHGLKWAASPRDVEMPSLAPIPGRINRNFRNYMETFPFFAAAVLTSQAAGVHNELTHWGSIAYIGGRIAYTALYISGIPLIRSLFWNIAAFGTLAVLAAPFVSR